MANMKTIDVSAASPTLSEVLQFADEGAVMLRTPDGREFLVAEVDDFEIEISRVRQNEELMQFLAERSKETKTYSLSEARKLLDLE